MYAVADIMTTINEIIADVCTPVLGFSVVLDVCFTFVFLLLFVTIFLEM